MNLYFVGGIFLDDDKEFIKCNSKGGVQNAADSFQKRIIGALGYWSPKITIINLPFVGSFPRRFRKFRVLGRNDFYLGNFVFGVSFINIAGLKYLFRFVGVFKALLRYNKDNSCFLIYSAHSPFLLASLLAKLFYRNFKYIVIIPDLPDYMSSEKNFIRKIIVSVNNFILKISVRHALGVVGLTEHIKFRLELKGDLYLTWEGCVDSSTEIESCNKFQASVNLPRKFILYSGGLFSRYGVEHLISSFLKLNNPEYYLVLCGSGDLESWIVDLEKVPGNKIIFLGQVPREDVIFIQSVASILVNPRLPVEEFTKYSFPSKTLEYMSSGRPVLMFELPGVPKEYFDHVVTPEFNNEESFSARMAWLMGLSDDDLSNLGKQSQDFINSKKSAETQGQLFYDFIGRLMKNDV